MFNRNNVQSIVSSNRQASSGFPNEALPQSCISYPKLQILFPARNLAIRDSSINYPILLQPILLTDNVISIILKFSNRE